MRKFITTPYLIIALFISSLGYVVSCSHDDDVVTAPPITRGTDVIKLTEGWTFDKTHSNVMWESAYMGSAAMLTGRFNQFGFTTISFDEAVPANTNFEAWVRLNTVNTGEPGRDAGCLLGTFGTALGLVDEANNLAIIKSKSVELSTTDDGYIINCDLTFHGFTKPVTAKMKYTGKARVNSATPYDVAGLTLEFKMLCKSDFGIVSNSVSDLVTIKSNAQFKKTL